MRTVWDASKRSVVGFTHVVQSIPPGGKKNLCAATAPRQPNLPAPALKMEVNRIRLGDAADWGYMIGRWRWAARPFNREIATQPPRRPSTDLHTPGQGTTREAKP